MFDEGIAWEPLAQMDRGKLGDMPAGPAPDRNSLPDAQIDDPSEVERDHVRQFPA